jgi:hypothetical protein
MTTRTGLGWGNTSPFQVTNHRQILGRYKTVLTGTKRNGKGTYNLFNNSNAPRINISLIKPCQALLGFDQSINRQIIGGPLPAGPEEQPITTGQLWPRY